MTPKNTLLLLGLIAVGLVMVPGCTPRYAVLMSSHEVTVDDVAYHSVWWYDLVDQYRMLRDSGFKDEEIFVLYGSGTDFATIHTNYNSGALYGHSITDRPMNKAEVAAVFDTVESELKKKGKKGYLHVWWMGHGGGSGPGQCDLSMQISHTGEYVSDDELRSYIDKVTRYKKRAVFVMTCHAGGILDEFAAGGESNIALASSTCPESSYEAPWTCSGQNLAEFNYIVATALREKTPCNVGVGSDTDGDGWVSLLEAHNFNASTMSTSTPQLGDPDNLAATTEPAKKSP